jgi:hypothetical protein
MLTTLESLKIILGISGSAEDATLTLLIKQAGSVIEGHCARPFGRHDEVFSRFLDRPQLRLVLPVRPVASVVSVMVGDAEIAAADYALESSGSGLLRRVGGLWPQGVDISVSYSAGWVLPGVDGRDLPEAVERACIALVRLWRAESGLNPLLKSTSAEGVGTDTFWVGGLPGGLPPEVESSLAAFRVVWFE